MRVICSFGKGISAIDADRVDMVSCNGGTYCTVIKGNERFNFEAVTNVDVNIPLRQEIVDITSTFKFVPNAVPRKCVYDETERTLRDTVTPVLICGLPNVPFSL